MSIQTHRKKPKKWRLVANKFYRNHVITKNDRVEKPLMDHDFLPIFKRNVYLLGTYGAGDFII